MKANRSRVQSHVCLLQRCADWSNTILIPVVVVELELDFYWRFNVKSAKAEACRRMVLTQRSIKYSCSSCLIRSTSLNCGLCLPDVCCGATLLV